MSHDDLLVLEDETIYQLQGAKPKAKAQRPLKTKLEEPAMKYIPRPPMKSEEPQELMSASFRTHRGRKILSHSNSTPLSRGPQRPRPSPSPKQPNSAPVQMMSVFQWPAIQRQTDHNHNSQSVQSSMSGMNGKQVDKEGEHPHLLPQIRRPGSAKKSQASLSCRESNNRQAYEAKRRTTSYRESDKRHDDEAKRRTTPTDGYENVGGFPPRCKLFMKAKQWQPASASHHRDPSSTPNMQENNRREIKKAMNNVKLLQCGNVRKKIICPTKSAPLPRPSPSMTSPSFASPSLRKPSSAPMQMMTAFQWPVIQGRIDQVQVTCNPSQARSRMITGEYHGSAQKTRVRFLKTESDGTEPTPLGEARSSRSDHSMEEECFNEVFDSPPSADSQTPIMVRCFQQETISRQASNGTFQDGHGNDVDVENYHGNNYVTPIPVEDKLNVPKFVHDMMRKSSPDSSVAQLIANSKNLTLYDSVESPTLQKRKRKAGASSKKFG